jgi:hypothetical protein
MAVLIRGLYHDVDEFSSRRRVIRTATQNIDKRKNVRKGGSGIVESPQFTEMDLHCIARLVQSSFQAPEQEEIKTVRRLYGCMYCKYAFECGNAVEQRGELFHYRKILRKLEELTGVREPYTPSTLEPDDIGRRFFPGSYYMEHPEALCKLKMVHPEHMMGDFGICLGKLIAHSKEKSDQK